MWVDSIGFYEEVKHLLNVTFPIKIKVIVYIYPLHKRKDKCRTARFDKFLNNF